jgi:uncharacterized protein (DUF433 family)
MSDGTPLPIYHIEAKPGSGTPRIAGKGVTVAFVAHLIENPEWNIRRICEEYDLSPGQVYAALSYYADHQEAIEQATAEAEQRLDRYEAEHPPTLRDEIMKRRREKPEQMPKG